MDLLNKTKKINVGNNIGNLITSYNIKYDIVSYLQRYINLNDIKFKLIRDNNDLNYIKNNNYLITPNYNGINYLLVFIDIKGIKYSVLIDKKHIKHNINFNDINIISIKLRASDELYKGTILDGKLLKQDNMSSFVVLDSYLLQGSNDIMKYTIDDRIKKIDKCINQDIIIDTNLLKMTVKLTKFYELSEIENLVNKMKTTNVSVNGIIFLNKKNVNHYLFYEKKNNNINAVFLMKKTDVIDVYDLYIYNDKNELVKKGIAGVPSMEISLMCRKLFEDKDSINMLCGYSDKFDKWIPIHSTTDNVNNNKQINDLLNNNRK